MMEGAAALDRAMTLLDALVRDQGQMPLSAHAARLNIPLSTAYRLVGMLRRHGLLAPARRGHFVAGLGLAALARFSDPTAMLIAIARPLLRRLACRYRVVAHLGILEGDMITYVVKEDGGSGGLFTREGEQLEAYCSAIGRVLLAHLPPAERDAYLDGGPFVPLTEKSVVDPDAIREILQGVQAHGFAIDDREIAENLYCVAVPVRTGEGTVIAGMSLSMIDDAPRPDDPVAALNDCAAQLRLRLS